MPATIFNSMLLFKRSNLNTRPANPSHFDRLPREILIVVFQYIAPILIPYDPFAVHHDDPARVFAVDFPSFLSSGTESDLLSLSRAILVCKTWYSLGVVLLYSKPIITRYSQLRTLARTLQRRSRLSNLVRSIMIILDEDVPHPKTTLLSRILRKEERSHSRYLKRLTTILSTCRHADDLDLCATLFLPQIIFPSLIAENISRSLRRLCMCAYLSSTWSCMDNHIIFLVLEELCLDSFVITNRWFELPSLRTLRLRYCAFTFYASLPSSPAKVHTLELTGIEANYDIASDLRPYHSTLESLQIGGLWCISLMHSLDYTLFTELKRVVLVFDDWSQKSLNGLPPMLRQTCGLEELVIVCSRKRYDNSVVSESGLAADVVNLLEGITMVPALRRLEVVGHNVAWNPEHIMPLCRARGMQLELRLHDKYH